MLKKGWPYFRNAESGRLLKNIVPNNSDISKKEFLLEIVNSGT